MPQQRYPVLWIGQVAVVRPPREIDTANAGQLREDLLSVVNQGAVRIIADLSKTTFCDSAGVGALVRTFRRAAANDCGMRLVVGTPAVRRVLAITGVDRLLDIYPSLAASLAGPCDRLDQNDPSEVRGLSPQRGYGGDKLPLELPLERRRRLRGLAAYAGNDRAGNVTELDITVLRRGSQDGDRAAGAPHDALQRDRQLDRPADGRPGVTVGVLPDRGGAS